MIRCIEDLEKLFSIANNKRHTCTFLKSVVSRNGKETFKLVMSRSHSVSVCPKVAKQFVRDFEENIVKLPYNSTSTDLYVRLTQ